MNITLAIISLTCLFFAVGIGFTRKVNTGILCIGFAFVIGKIAGLKESAIIGGWNTSLFIMLLGITLLFSITQQNGTLDLLSRKILARSSKISWSLPFVLYLLALVFSAFSSPIPVMAVLISLGMVLSKELNISPFLLAVMPTLGSSAGGISPISTTGIVVHTLMGAQGFSGFGIDFLMNGIIINSLFAVIVFFVFKGHKIRITEEFWKKEIPMFNKKQTITIVVILALVVLDIIFGLNIGLMAFVGVGILMSLKVGEEKECFFLVPWGTLIMICGVGVLMNVIFMLGGVKILSEFLSIFMTKNTAPAVLALTGGIMSWFSSTVGVVIPTLIPTVSDLINNVQGTDPTELISAIVNTAHVAGLSPISTAGGLALASYTVTRPDLSAGERNNFFVSIFLISFSAVVFYSLLAGLGIYRIIYIW